MGGFGILIPAPIRFLQGSQTAPVYRWKKDSLRDIEFNRDLKQGGKREYKGGSLRDIEFNRGLKRQTHQTEDIPPRLSKYITDNVFCHAVVCLLDRC